MYVCVFECMRTCVCVFILSYIVLHTHSDTEMVDIEIHTKV